MAGGETVKEPTSGKHSETKPPDGNVYVPMCTRAFFVSFGLNTHLVDTSVSVFVDLCLPRAVGKRRRGQHVNDGDTIV